MLGGTKFERTEPQEERPRSTTSWPSSMMAASLRSAGIHPNDGTLLIARDFACHHPLPPVPHAKES